jgi:hypothetical protein
LLRFCEGRLRPWDRYHLQESSVVAGETLRGALIDSRDHRPECVEQIVDHIGVQNGAMMAAHPAWRVERSVAGKTYPVAASQLNPTSYPA